MALDNDTRQAVEHLKNRMRNLEKRNEELEKEINVLKFRTKGYEKRFNILQKLFLRKTRRT